MFAEITFYTVFGLPLIVYGGILTFLLFMATAVLGYGIRKGLISLDMKWHYRLAYLLVLIVLVHALFGLLAYV